MVRQACAQHAYFAWPGDMNQVRAKAIEDFSDDGDMPGKCGVKAQIFFERKGEDSARKFKRPDVAVFDERLSPVAGADAEKGQIVATRERLEVAACVRDSIDLVERVRKIRYSGQF